MPAAAAAVNASPPTDASRPPSRAERAASGEGFHEERWPKTRRLRRTAEFARVYDTGRKVHGAYLVCFVRCTGTAAARVGITVGRKVGNAVTRNRVRRRLRAWVRSRYDRLPAGLEVVVVARAAAAGADTAALRADLENCLDRGLRSDSA